MIKIIIFEKILVLMLIQSSVLSKCLLPAKTGNWNLLIPFVYPDRVYKKYINNKYENFSFGTRTLEECRNITDDIRRTDYTFLERLNNNKIKADYLYEKYVIVLTNASFSEGHYYDQQGQLHLSWDTNLKYLLNIMDSEAEESVIIEPMTKFVTFRMGNGLNFSLQLVENKNDVWTTNEPFLFLSNNSRSCISFREPYSLLEIFLNRTNNFSCNDLIIASSTDLLGTIIIPVVIIIVIIIVVSIVCTCVLNRFYSEKRKQTIENKYHVFYQHRKQKTCEDNDSGYMEVVEVHEYAEAGNANRIFYDLQGNRVNQILESEEQLDNYYAYATFKPSKSLDNRENRRSDVSYEQIFEIPLNI